jgi:hypothetical protein
VTCSASPSPSLFGYSPLAAQAAKKLGFDEDFLAEPFGDQEVQINQNSLGIPSEIKVVVPVFPEIKVKHDIPQSIKVDDIPPIRLVTEDAVPTEIKIIGQDTIPRTITLDASNVPEAIKLDASRLPNALQLQVPSEFPEIKVDASDLPREIEVTGIPDSLEVKIPSEIVAKLEVPENLEVPLVYKGGPVPVEFGKSTVIGEDDSPCFKLVPCSPK